MTETDIARACHEANRAYCQALGDMSQPAWDDAPEWQRSSALMGVRLHLNNPDAGPQASHESWMAQKVAEGWVYGPTKDPEAKTHHCIVPFDQLPREQQAKDFIFRAVVHALRPADPVDQVRAQVESLTALIGSRTNVVSGDVISRALIQTVDSLLLASHIPEKWKTK